MEGWPALKRNHVEMDLDSEIEDAPLEGSKRNEVEEEAAEYEGDEDESEEGSASPTLDVRREDSSVPHDAQYVAMFAGDGDSAAGPSHSKICQCPICRELGGSSSDSSASDSEWDILSSNSNRSAHDVGEVETEVDENQEMNLELADVAPSHELDQETNLELADVAPSNEVEQADTGCVYGSLTSSGAPFSCKVQ